MGLGSLRKITLAEARRRRQIQVEILARDANPVEVRKRERAAEIRGAQHILVLSQMVFPRPLYCCSPALADPTSQRSQQVDATEAIRTRRAAWSIVMEELRQLLSDWPASVKPNPDETAEFSIVTSGGDGALRSALSQALSGHAFELRPAFPGNLRRETGDRFWILRLPDLGVVGNETRAFDVARALARLEGVDSSRPVLVDSLVGAAMVQRNEELAFFGCESDDQGPEARGWAPLGLGVLEAWKKTKGAGIRIASIDTGYSSHQQLEGVIDQSRPHLNLVEGGADAHDQFSTDVLLSNPGHGTLVASVVASRGALTADGSTDSSKGVTGSAPEAQILPIRAIRSVVDLRQSRIPAAIEHAIETDCDLIVMALGSAFPIEPVEVALRAAVQRGMVIVCAAGNCVGEVVFPARFAPHGLTTAVAAVDYAYVPWEKTSKGDAVTVSAFGEAVWGARKNKADAADDVIRPSQGTTLATSLTVGAAALWLAAHGGRDKVKQAADAAGVTVQRMFNDLVAATAYRPAGWPSGMGAGLVNAGALVNRPLPGANEAVPQPALAPDHVTPLSRFLRPAVAEHDSVAGLEAATLPEDLAAETLWRLYLASARRRLQAATPQRQGLEGREAPPRPPTDALQAEIAARPRLLDLVR